MPGRWSTSLVNSVGRRRAAGLGDPHRHRHRVRARRARGRSARHLPAALRTFLLTLAVVDDLLAITIIAIFYTAELRRRPAAPGPAAVSALFAVLVQRRIRSWWLLLPLAVVAWALMHASGRPRDRRRRAARLRRPGGAQPRRRRPGGRPGLAEHFEHRFRPLSAGVAVPVFAFFAAGVTVGGLDRAARRRCATRSRSASSPGSWSGKPVGILGTTWLVARFTRAEPRRRAWPGSTSSGVALLGGIGFTVSLLIGDLAFGADATREDHVKVGVLTGSLLAALLAAVVLRSRDRAYRRIAQRGVDRRRRRRRAGRIRRPG